ncbi:MAG: PhzF family phenazine biosynthesis protein [Rhodospirillales bacterium]|nr:PhzF family phenazine biosynthesis protein [Rhodospirillales bacterium]
MNATTPRHFPYETVAVFTDRRFAGNPLAVFPAAEGLSATEMQAIAAEFNLSETAFVLPPEDGQHHAKVRIFTPQVELPFAGHPNVGTGFVLAQALAAAGKPLPEHFVFEEKAGLVRVHLLRNEAGAVIGARVAAPQSLQLGDEVATETIAACIGLDPSEVATAAHRPLFASVGTPFVIAELTSPAALARATPDLAAFRAAATTATAKDLRFALLVYAWDDAADGARTIRARMFAPLSGMIEDPATGSANAALAALLTALAPGDDVDLSYDILQGVEMGRPSRLIGAARKTPEGPVLASIAGQCVATMRGVFTL